MTFDTSENFKEEMDEEILDSDSIESEEEIVYSENLDENICCTNCRRPLGIEDETIEEQIDGEIKQFCDERCAKIYLDKKRHD